jgi:3,4-dihydroxy-2-butanone 4-phosphate synthase
MSKLSTSCKALAGALAEACATQQLKSLTADGDGQICLQMADADDKRVVVNFVFFDPDEYPRSGVLVQMDEDKSKCSSTVADKLGALSERFQDGAQLWAAIAKV